MSALSPPPDNPKKIVTSFYRVLYIDTDLMGIVNNANYFRFFEQGRGEYLRRIGSSYASIEERGIRTPITEAFAHFYLPFRYDDLIRIDTWISQLKKASLRFEYRLYKDPNPTLMGAGHTVHAALNLDNKVVKIPDWLLEDLGRGAEG
jgi:acyl-CoA thioester hydrolase